MPLSKVTTALNLTGQPCNATAKISVPVRFAEASPLILLTGCNQRHSRLRQVMEVVVFTAHRSTTREHRHSFLVVSAVRRARAELRLMNSASVAVQQGKVRWYYSKITTFSLCPGMQSFHPMPCSVP